MQKLPAIREFREYHEKVKIPWWPFLKQVAARDLTAFNGPAVSPRSAQPRPADAHRRPRREVGLPVLRRRLRPGRLRPGRQDHRHRRRSRFADLATAASAPRARPPSNWSPARTASTTCSTAARTAREWETIPLEQAMDMVAERVQQDARRHLGRRDRRRRSAAPHPGHRAPRRRHARQRRELPHQEAVHRARHRPDRKPGPYLTLLHGPQFGDLVRTRRRHHVPAGSAERGLHRHPGLEHGGVPPGRLPLGDGGQASAAPPSSTSIRASRAPARWPTFTCRSAPARDIAFLGGIIRYILENERYFQRVRRELHQRRRDHQRGLPRHRGPRRPLQRLGRGEGRVRHRHRGCTRASSRSRPPARASSHRRAAIAKRAPGPTAEHATRRCSIRAASSRS